MPFEQQRIEHLAKNPERCFVHKLVFHEAATLQWFEIVFVPHRLKRSARHLVGEEMRKFEVSNAYRELLLHAKVPRLPGDFITQLADTRSAPCDHALASRRGRAQVQADVERRTKTDFNRCVDLRFEKNFRHGLKALFFRFLRPLHCRRARRARPFITTATRFTLAAVTRIKLKTALVTLAAVEAADFGRHPLKAAGSIFHPVAIVLVIARGLFPLRAERQQGAERDYHKKPQRCHAY